MKKVLLVALAMMLVSSLILSGCAAPAPAPTPAPAPAPAPDKYGGILQWNFGMPASNFGTPWNVRHWNHVYAGLCLEGLVQGTPEGQAGVLIPMLATSWELAPDKSHYIFHLRQGVKFHDGTDWNAQAAKWNFDKWIPLERPFLKTVKSVDVVDDYTIRLNLTAWDSVFLNDIARHLVMISPTAYEKNGEEWMNVHAIGTGPFMIKEFARNQLVTYEKNPDYWQEGLPYLDGMEVLQMPDPMTAIAALKKGEVLVLNEVPTPLAAEIRATGDFDVQWIPALHEVIVMNSTNPDSIWSDKRMREALEYAVDKDKISSALGEGFVGPVYEIVHSIHLSGSPKTTPRKYDPEKAKQLMAEAGYADGVKVTLTVGAEQDHRFYVALQENLAAAGIQVELNPVTGAALNQMSFEPAQGSDLRIEQQRGGPGNPLGSARETLSEKSVYLPGLKRPQGFEALLDQALQEPDTDKQLALLLQMEEMAYEDVMFVPLWNKPIIAVINPVIQGAHFFYGGGPGVRLEKAWLP